ncbi:MAG: redox-regulated ATPase YchF [Chloroflexi bacterium]|nr:redox-regulated ATPase YchF [Chloroflexota bacterium]
MSVEIGIMGLAGAGKTTVFNALARARVAVATYAAPGGEPHRAVVHVPDQRLERLAALFQPRKVTPAEVRYVDVAGSLQTDGTGARAAQVVGQLRNADALLLVIRAFASDVVPHPLGQVDPLRDLRLLHEDLVLNDLTVVERRLERLEKELRFARNAPPEAARERGLLEQIKEALESGRPIRDLGLADADAKLLRSYGFLTAKPLMILFNTGDTPEGIEEIIAAARAAQPYARTEVTSLAGRLEMELAELEPAEAEEFKTALGIAELGLSRVIQLSYRLLDLISFLTVGPDECRAWTVRRGSTAVDAAGVIHTDLARGFIRAEVIGWEALLEAGGWNEAKRRGLVRSEGRGYVVQDGDVINVLFSV